MKNITVGFVGWRGLVGSVLMNRMIGENDFGLFEKVFFSTSNASGKTDAYLGDNTLKDAYNISELRKCDIIVSCQGSDWTNEMYPKLIDSGWKGYFLDASSALRMSPDSIIVLDPINRDDIISSLQNGGKLFCGGNCTVSLMLLALHGLLNEIKWIHSSTYQAASGAGSRNMLELVAQMKYIGDKVSLRQNVLKMDKNLSEEMKNLPADNFGVPLAGSLIPWIDIEVEGGRTKEEQKGYLEANKILQSKIAISGTCVRVPVMRCHSQSLLVKLKRNIELEEISKMIEKANQWVITIPNEEMGTKKLLSPAGVSGTLYIAVGRIKKAMMGNDYLELFTVGDQLLWGAAEPIRRALKIIINHIK